MFESSHIAGALTPSRMTPHARGLRDRRAPGMDRVRIALLRLDHRETGCTVRPTTSAPAAMPRRNGGGGNNHTRVPPPPPPPSGGEDLEDGGERGLRIALRQQRRFVSLRRCVRAWRASLYRYARATFACAGGVGCVGSGWGDSSSRRRGCLRVYAGEENAVRIGWSEVVGGRIGQGVP